MAKDKDEKDLGPEDQKTIDKLAEGITPKDKRAADTARATGVALAGVGSNDYAEVFPAIHAAGIGGTIEGAAKFYKQNRDILDWVFGLLKGVLGKKKKQQEEPQVSPGGTAPAPSLPPVVVATPPPLPTVTPSFPQRAVHGLRLDPYWIGQNDNPFNKAHFDAVVSGDDPLPADGHTKLHMDLDPLDQQGSEIRPGSPELAELVNAEGIPQIQWKCLVDGRDGYAAGVNLGSITPDENDPYGCTPSFKPTKGMRDGKDHYAEVWAEFASKTAGRLESNHFKFRIK